MGSSAACGKADEAAVFLSAGKVGGLFWREESGNSEAWVLE